MHAMVLHKIGGPLVWTELPDRQRCPEEIRLKVVACGVCRTHLHVVDGELPDPHLPIVPGHEIVGRIDALGSRVTGLQIGERFGVPWRGHTCGVCAHCRGDHENLRDAPIFTGYTRDGGYATSVVADARFAFPRGEKGEDVSLAPLLCAGLIGWRSLVMAGDAKRLGLYGFGAAAHITAQVARWQGRVVYAFTSPGDGVTQDFARSLGAVWAGGSDKMPSEPLDASIILASVGSLVPAALKAALKGGRVVCAGIHKSDIPSFPYSLLWEERQVVAVAHLTRQDGIDCVGLARKIKISTPDDILPASRGKPGVGRHARRSLRWRSRAGDAVNGAETSSQSW